MTEQPQVWHYGLVAKWWAEFSHGGEDIPYFQAVIEKYGQPALDVGCGTGRLLLPYLRAGLGVDGSDISGDMLEGCRELAAVEGLSPQLYQQALHELDLPRRYKTIFINGVFGQGGIREHDLEALRRFYAHLEPGGVLALEGGLSYDLHVMQYADPEKRRELPEEEWVPMGMEGAADGSVYKLYLRTIDFNPLEQTKTIQIRTEVLRDDEPVGEDVQTMVTCMYFRHELQMMLEQVGFRDIVLQGDFTEAEVTPDHGVLVFLARK